MLNDLRYEPLILSLGCLRTSQFDQSFMIIFELHYGCTFPQFPRLDGSLMSSSIQTLSESDHSFRICTCRKLEDKFQEVLLTHGDSIEKLGNSMKTCAISGSNVIAAIYNEKLKIYGVQFHPEVCTAILTMPLAGLLFNIDWFLFLYIFSLLHFRWISQLTACKCLPAF